MARFSLLQGDRYSPMVTMRDLEDAVAEAFDEYSSWQKGADPSGAGFFEWLYDHLTNARVPERVIAQLKTWLQTGGLGGKTARTFMATGSGHAGTSGFVNYLPSATGLTYGLKEVFKTFGDDAVVIDGDDDWYAAKLAAPARVAEAAGVMVLGFFHSGISGMAKSGIVIRKRDRAAFLRKFKELATDPKWTTRLRGKGPEPVTLRIYQADGGAYEPLRAVPGQVGGKRRAAPASSLRERVKRINKLWRGL